MGMSEQLNKGEVLGTKAAAEIIGWSEAYLRIVRSHGGGPRFTKVNKRLVQYSRSDVISWNEQRKREKIAAIMEE